MQPLRGAYGVPHCPFAVATQRLPSGQGGDHEQLETLLFFKNGRFCRLLGANGHGGLEVGPPQRLQPDIGHDEVPLWNAVYDSYSDALYVSYGGAVGRVSAGGLDVQVVAGDPYEEGEADGPGPNAKLPLLTFLCADGRGCLYAADGDDDRRVVRLQLPASWRAGAGPSFRAGGAAEQVIVTTLALEMPSDICGLAWAPGTGTGTGSGGGVLLIATTSAIYRLPLSEGVAVDNAAAPFLCVGNEDEPGRADGSAIEPRFMSLYDLCVDAEGAVLAVDQQGDETTAVRRVAPDGTVTTLIRVSGQYRAPSILPNVYLLLCAHLGQLEHTVLVLDLGLKPVPFPGATAPAAAAGPPRRMLHADMGALLDAQPDGTADLTLVVAGRRFPVHRAILIARGDYFKRRLAAETFADGGAAELSLPDTDPAAFALLLRFVYTGAADIPPALAPAVAELADRLLLPELCADAQYAQTVILSALSAETVVGSLLWAQRLGGAFSGLLSSLKAWYLEHHEEVLEAAPESVGRLAESPGLMLELMRGLKGGGAKRRRIA